MRKVSMIAGLVALVFGASAWAADAGSLQLLDLPLSPTYTSYSAETGQVIGHTTRTQKHYSYDNIYLPGNNGPFYILTGGTATLPQRAFADDIGFEKLPGADKQNIQRFFAYWYTASAPTQLKIDFYDSGGGIYLPGGANAPIFTFTTAPLPPNPSYIQLIEIVFDDPGFVKPDIMWASIQTIGGNANTSVVFSRFASGAPNPGFSDGNFAISFDGNKQTFLDNYSLGGTNDSYVTWTFINTPEPASMALLAGGAVALLRRRR